MLKTDINTWRIERSEQTFLQKKRVWLYFRGSSSFVEAIIRLDVELKYTRSVRKFIVHLKNEELFLVSSFKHLIS